jgi:hypothetical protein
MFRDKQFLEHLKILCRFYGLTGFSGLTNKIVLQGIRQPFFNEFLIFF